MPEDRSSGENYIPVGGVILLFLGIVFLLQTLNVLPWALWGTLWRYWPVILIAIGLGILLRSFNAWIVSLLILVLLFGSLGLALWQYNAGVSSPGQTTRNYTQPLNGMKGADVQVNFNAGRLTFGSLAADSSNFVEINSRERELRADFSREGDRGRLRLSAESARRGTGGDIRWDVKLTRSIPMLLDARLAANDALLDLKDLNVTELRLDVDASNCRLVVPAAAGSSWASIDADVTNLEITIPEGVSVRLKVDSDLSAVEVDQRRFPRQGDYFQSSDYDSARNRIDIDIECNVSRVQVK